MDICREGGIVLFIEVLITPGLLIILDTKVQKWGLQLLTGGTSPDAI